MRGEFIAFDLETTGLDPRRDEIIEIGIARFRQGEIIDKFESLIKPSIPIPPDITHLTGIHPEDVDDAPPIADLRAELRRFFGKAPIVAHNINFDLSFMRKLGLLKSNPAIDTYELAAIVLPSAPRYNLASLAALLGIKLDRAHRAYADAEATGRMYWRLWRKLRELPSGLLSEIIQASSGLGKWALREVFQAALADSLDSALARPLKLAFVAEALDADELDPSEAKRDPLPLAEIDRVFAVDGPLGAGFDAYERREEQTAMAREVAEALNRGEQRMIEAGTGTGKSLAYLAPAALWALRNGQRVTVSTYTINLQNQLLDQDIPLASRAAGGGLRAALMKGRGNYLCPRRLNTMRRRKPASLDELRALAKILVWLSRGGGGDRGEITLRGGEWAAWRRLSAQDEGCSTFRCASEMAGVCPFYRARRKAETAHILITNHALLIADARIDNRALPAYQNLIVDEAHHLEAAITDGLSRQFELRLILMRLRDLGDGKSGALGAFQAAARGHLPPDDWKRLSAFIEIVGDAIALLKPLLREYFRAVHDFAAAQGGDNRYAMRLAEKQRDSGRFADAQSKWQGLARVLLALNDAMERLCAGLPRYDKFQLPDLAEYRSEIRAHWHYFVDLHEQLEQFTQTPQTNAVYSLKASESPERLQIVVSPLHVGPLMEEYLSGRMESIVLTSATLRAGGSFDHIKARLYSEDYKTTALGSPFDYRRSTLLYIPKDLPEPNRRYDYQRMLERGVIELAAALEGRVMVLFTSYAQLRETSKAITARLNLGDIMVYDQSFGGSREVLLESFKRADKAVLMGTRSFWEGVDIPGDDLSAVVIAKLPFAVPSDPIFSARAEGYSNSFQQYAVPDAILRFRQGFGRLIRRRTDRGIVAVFDSRVISKSYGASFLESLPDCTVKYGALDQLAQAARDWMDETGAEA